MQPEEARILDVYEERDRLLKYSLFADGNLFIHQDRERSVLRLLKKSHFENLSSKKILDVGCGSGNWIRDFIRWGASPENITGIDLMESRAAQAKITLPAAVILAVGSATKLPLADSSQDLILQSTVFTSVLDDGLRKQIAMEMFRVLRPGGFILWYDFHWNNPSNPNVRGVTFCEICDLFPEADFKRKRITLLPPLVRWLAPLSWTLCEILNVLPFLKSHSLVQIQKSPLS